MALVRTASAILLSLALALAGCATGLQPASSPEAVGLSSDRLMDISAAFQAGVEKKDASGNG